jgi:cell division septal protein FtsQ
MRPINVQKIRNHDRLAQRQRKVFIAKAIAAGIGAVSFVGGIVYFFLFSSSLEIQQVHLDGLKKVDAAAIDQQIQSVVHAKWLRYVEPQKNILLFDSTRLRASLLDQFPALKDVSIDKKAMHEVTLTFTEREALGVWCFHDACKYFDDTGVLWGQPVRSSGFLFFTVNDLRDRDASIEPEWLDAIRTVQKGFQGLHVGLKDIAIPTDRLREFQANTSNGYPVLFSLDADLAKQMEVFRIFIEKKGIDPNFHPLYVDLRIDGRVYYKNQ